VKRVTPALYPHSARRSEKLPPPEPFSTRPSAHAHNERFAANAPQLFLPFLWEKLSGVSHSVHPLAQDCSKISGVLYSTFLTFPLRPTTHMYLGAPLFWVAVRFKKSYLPPPVECFPLFFRLFAPPQLSKTRKFLAALCQCVVPEAIFPCKMVPSADSFLAEATGGTLWSKSEVSAPVVSGQGSNPLRTHPRNFAQKSEAYLLLYPTSPAWGGGVSPAKLFY